MAVSHAIDWVLLDHASDQPVHVGDVVSAEPGGMPIFKVTAVTGHEVQLANERDAPVGVLPLDRFRWRGSEH